MREFNRAVELADIITDFRVDKADTLDEDTESRTRRLARAAYYEDFDRAGRNLLVAFGRLKDRPLLESPLPPETKQCRVCGQYYTQPECPVDHSV